METKKCIVCSNMVPQTPGKKEKKYCSPACRQKDWQQKRRNEIASFREIGTMSQSPSGLATLTSDPKLVKEFNKSINKPIPAPKTKKPADTKEKKQEVFKDPESGITANPDGTWGIPVEKTRPAKQYDVLIRITADKASLEILKQELAANPIIDDAKKKTFNTRIDFKLNRLTANK